MKKFRFLSLFMASLLALGFVGCKDKDEIPEVEGSLYITMTPGASIDLENYVGHDPKAGYGLTVHITRPEEGDPKLVITGGENTYSDYVMTQYPGDFLSTVMLKTKAYIATVGAKRGLCDVTYDLISSLQFNTTELPLVDSTGYIVKVVGDGQLTGSYPDYPDVRDPEDLYIRLYCKTNEAGELVLNYQYPFVYEPPVE